MTVDPWVRHAVEAAGARGATPREVQRRIDEHQGEELAMDTILASLASLERAGRVQRRGDERWTLKAKTDEADAVRRLFGE